MLWEKYETKIKRNQIKKIVKRIIKYFRHERNRIHRLRNTGSNYIRINGDVYQPNNKISNSSRVPFGSKSIEKGQSYFSCPLDRGQRIRKLCLLISRSVVGSGYRISASMDYPLKLSSRKSVSKGKSGLISKPWKRMAARGME